MKFGVVAIGAGVVRPAEPEPGDEQQGGWPREQLVRMDARFCERLERAIGPWKGASERLREILGMLGAGCWSPRRSSEMEKNV